MVVAEVVFLLVVKHDAKNLLGLRYFGTEVTFEFHLDRKRLGFVVKFLAEFILIVEHGKFGDVLLLENVDYCFGKSMGHIMIISVIQIL